MIRTAGIFLLAWLPMLVPAEALYEAEFIFPLEHWHNHGSCIVEQPNGDLLACWFHGSGERKEDDVAIYGARKVRGEKGWRGPFVMADVPGFPDTNCCMIIDSSQKLWLIWPTIMANLWESAILKIRTSTDYQKDVDRPPHWEWQDVLHVKPGPDFETQFNQSLDAYLAAHKPPLGPEGDNYIQALRKKASDKFTTRVGWMTRAHPTILPSGRMIVPMYSDGFDCSLMAITDDGGATWRFSNPLVGGMNIQPSIVRKKDGTLVAVMRDNGPPPQRMIISHSTDDGLTWGEVTDYDLPNPGSGLEWIVLKSGEWVLIYNDTEEGRNSLAVSVSDDEGRSWKWTRHLERRDGSYSYPSIIQASDSTLHATYSYHGMPGECTDSECKTIKYAHFNLEWIKQGE